MQFPHSTQGYNRYTYVNNNPLSFTDPSGYLSLKDFGKFLSDVAPLLNFIPACYVWCAAVASAVGGYLQTGSWSTGIKAGAMTAAASYFGGKIGNAGWGPATTAFAQGMVGGALSEAGGGRFGDGFLGGAAGSLASNIAPTGDLGTDMVVGAIVGGSVARISGGKFANGAVSGAFAAAIASTTKQSTSESERARTKTVRWDGEGEMPEHLKSVASDINEGLAETARALNAKADAGKLEYYGGKSEIQIFNETDHIITNDMGFAKGHGFTAAQTNLVNGNTVTKWYGLSAGRYLGTPDLNAFAVSHELAHALPGHGAYTFGNHSAYLANPIPFENAANEYASTLNGYRY